MLLRQKKAGSGDQVVALKQVAVSLPPDAPARAVAEAEAKLIRLRRHLTGCDTLEEQTAKTPGVLTADLGRDGGEGPASPLSATR